jgi:hypothetical protein
MAAGFEQFDGAWGERARLAWDAMEMRPTEGIPSWMVHTMDPRFIETATGRPAGDFERDPEGVYLQFQHRCEVCFIDQFIPRNVLSMQRHGFGSQTSRGATTGAESLILDGMAIDSPEAVVEHLERFVFPAREAEIRTFPARQEEAVAELVAAQVGTQKKFGPDMLKVPYGGHISSFPILGYQTYGYADYFMAYALYPEVMERDFRQQADLAVLKNAASARAIVEGRLPRLLRLDFDMADSRGMLADIRSLDRLWLPHFARAVEPLARAGIRLIWHCDGNLMDLVPRLLECGIGGFQGFQYEDGMDYEKICRMTSRRGDPLFILAGVSSTRTLPFGTPQDVRDQLKWLVDKGPPVGLALGASSSITPGTKHENIQALIEGLKYYRRRGGNR